MTELSKEAQAALDELAAGMTPTVDEEARAWARLSDGMNKQSRRPWVLRIARRIGMHLWRIAIPAAVIAVFIFIASALMHNDVGSQALLSDATQALQQEEYVRAYKLLQQHSERFKTKKAAEARVPLVLDALCGMGKRDKADAYLERYLELVPDSPMAERQADVCPLGTEHLRRLEEP